MENDFENENFDDVGMSLDFDMNMPLFNYEADKLIDFEFLKQEYPSSRRSNKSDMITEIKVENELLPTSFFDPDDFLNDVIKKEVVSNDSDSSGSRRNSPTPSSYSSGSSLNSQFASNILLDSPPVSPPQIITFPNFVPIQKIPQISNNLENNSKKIMNKIILSPDDYKAFMKHNGIVIKTPIITQPKASPPITGQPPVPPKVISPKPMTVDPTLDPKKFKRQQRMIKNRESAYLSRVKKKEYVTSLEEKIEELNKENVQLKIENKTLIEKLQRCSCGGLGHQIEISKFGKQSMKKNATIMFAILFMVSLNFSPLGNLLNSRVQNVAEPPSPIHHTRSLLWIDEEMFDQNSSSIGAMFNNSSVIKKEVCPFNINQTENIRLASELRKWIGENGYKNLTNSYNPEEINFNTLSDMFGFKNTLDSMYKEIKDINSQMKTFARKKKMAAKKIKSKKVKELQLFHKNRTQDIQLFNSNFKYSELFEEIGRKDDTFYVVSFSGEHLLLPALAYNKSNRPKMSLMLPAISLNGSNASEKVTLMQIDCEVMNTSMISVREKFIPENLKSHAVKKETGKNRQYQNSGANVTSHIQKNLEKPFNLKPRMPVEKIVEHSKRPYFINKIDESIRSEFGIY